MDMQCCGRSTEKKPIMKQETSLFTAREIQLVRSSHNHGWSDLFVAHTYEQASEHFHHPVPLVWIIMGLQDFDMQRTICGHDEYGSLPAYSLAIVPPLTPVNCRVSTETEAVHVFLRPDLLYEVADELFGLNPDQVCLQPVFGKQDTSLSWLLRSLKRFLVDPVQLSRLKTEYIARALCVDLLGKCSSSIVASNNPISTSGLASQKLRRIEDYISEHLGDDISVGDIAALCGMGRTIFHTRFKATLHTTPHQYIMRMRLDKARQMLSETSLSMTEISYACGFSGQAHLTTLFKRAVGVTPSAYRRSTI